MESTNYTIEDDDNRQRKSRMSNIYKAHNIHILTCLLNSRVEYEKKIYNGVCIIIMWEYGIDA
jgi:hypothetical protein